MNFLKFGEIGFKCGTDIFEDEQKLWIWINMRVIDDNFHLWKNYTFKIIFFKRFLLFTAKFLVSFQLQLPVVQSKSSSLCLSSRLRCWSVIQRVIQAPFLPAPSRGPARLPVPCPVLVRPPAFQSLSYGPMTLSPA